MLVPRTSVLCLGQYFTCHGFHGKRFLHSPLPSFSTFDIKATKKTLSYRGMAWLVITGQPQSPLPLNLGIKTDQFLRGAKNAVESVSHGIANKNIHHLDSQVTRACLASLQERVFLSLSPGTISSSAIKAEDIFLQFVPDGGMEATGGTVRIDVVSFSMNNLFSCSQTKRKLREFHIGLQERAKRTKGVLQKGDVNMAEFRRINDNFDRLNPTKLLKENDVVISRYRFVKSLGSDDWTVEAVEHVNSKEVWRRLTRLIWKARIHVSLQLEMEFRKVLRYDYIVDIAALALLFYLQIIAIVIGYRVEREKRRRKQQDYPVNID